MNPKDILGSDPSGAIKSPYDARDHLYSEVGYGSAPFDWNAGYDVEVDVGHKLGIGVCKFPIKNQGISGSCGGQSESYLGATLSAFFDNRYDEKSAKFSYAPVAQSGGGSTGRDLASRAINAGWGSESLTRSYENGQPPSETFMEAASDITYEAIQSAKLDKAISYALVNLDIESVAQAARDNKGVRIGIVGSNNKTWLSAFPKPPIDGENFWYHWVTVGKAKLIDGKKYVGFSNSWGVSAGDNGWQWIGEDYFTQHLANNPYGNIPLFEARTYLFNPNNVPASFHHTFNVDMQFGMSGSEVQYLQTALQVNGCFPSNIAPTLYFGNVTKTAVQKFQTKYGISIPGSAGYGRCGPKTRAALNALYSS